MLKRKSNLIVTLKSKLNRLISLTAECQLGQTPAWMENKPGVSRSNNQHRRGPRKRREGETTSPTWSQLIYLQISPGEKDIFTLGIWKRSFQVTESTFRLKEKFGAAFVMTDRTLSNIVYFLFSLLSSSQASTHHPSLNCLALITERDTSEQWIQFQNVVFFHRL